MVLAVAVAAVLALAGCSASPRIAQVTEVASTAADGDGRTWIRAVGTVDGVAERGGVCRFTFWFENGAASRLTATSSVDGERTVCGPVSEQIGRVLPDGEYEVELRYDSTSTAVRSERVPFEIRGGVVESGG
jgi:hypothetical protein